MKFAPLRRATKTKSRSRLAARMNSSVDDNLEYQNTWNLLEGGVLRRGHRTTFPGISGVGPPYPRLTCSMEPAPIEGSKRKRPHRHRWLLYGR